MEGDNRKWLIVVLSVILMFTVLFVVVEQIYESRRDNSTIENLNQGEVNGIQQQIEALNALDMKVSKMDNALKKEFVELKEQMKFFTVVQLMNHGYNKNQAIDLLKKNTVKDLPLQLKLLGQAKDKPKTS